MEPILLADILPVINARVAAGEPDGIRFNRINTDSRHAAAGDFFIALAGEKFDGHDFVRDALAKKAAACLVSRKVEVGPNSPAPLLQVNDTLLALQSLAAWHRRRLAGRVIAITGANGKTTTKGLLAHVLAGALQGQASPESFNNHIGVPLTLLSANTGDDFLVVEIGTNHPGEVAILAKLASPDLAIITSLSESHLEGLGNLAGVAKEETSQLTFLRSSGTAYVNADHPQLLEAAKACQARIVTFGLNPAADIIVSDVQADDSGLSFQLKTQNSKLKTLFRMPLPGRHNAINAAPVWAVARELGVPDSIIRERFANFIPPKSRNNLIRQNGLTILDDCYNANPGSMKAALATLHDLSGDRRVFVCGDMLELGDQSARLHAELGLEIARSGVDLLLAIGPMSAGVTQSCPEVPSRRYSSVAEATQEIPGLVLPGDCVLIKGSRGMKLEQVREAILKETPKSE